jgi:ABC-2 type transport system permease protein
VKIEQLEKKRDRDIDQIDTDLRVQIRRVQDRYKMWAVLLPPIPPLMLAVIVFFTRRVREREGIARSRLRS